MENTIYLQSLVKRFIQISISQILLKNIILFLVVKLQVSRNGLKMNMKIQHYGYLLPTIFVRLIYPTLHRYLYMKR